ncbi:MAG: M14 family metallopeptidase [Sulfuricellaceae bacterium]
MNEIACSDQNYHFSDDYKQAREKFLTAAKANGATIETHVLEGFLGKDGETLATDVAWLGPKDAKRVVITISATHGVEGFAGSAIQTGWFYSKERTAAPDDIALLAIHANNPYGFSWLRRFNEQNIDVNRNFINYENWPANVGYTELAKTLCPEKWTPFVRFKTLLQLGLYNLKNGQSYTQKASSGGQYYHHDAAKGFPDGAKGIFYGGREASWSRKTLLKILNDKLSEAKFITVVDIHTGLGDYGTHVEICNLKTRKQFDIAYEWYGETCQSPTFGEKPSVSTGNFGTCVAGIDDAFPGKLVTGFTLEYGTLPGRKVLNAVRADNWLQFHGDPSSDKGIAIKQQICDAFYCDNMIWKEYVYKTGIDALMKAFNGISKIAD